MDDYFVLVAGVLGVFVIAEILMGKFHTKDMSLRETLLDLAAFLQASVVIGPLIVFGTAQIESWLFPGMAGRYADVPWYWQLAAFIFFEDMLQYWYHRACHRIPWLWGIHKFHHTPVYMGVRVVWRNGLFYNLLMPNLWLSGILVYLGFGEVYFWYYFVKLCVTLGAHCELRWDSLLYRHKALHPLAWVVERTVSTPATHFAHHAYTEDDGIGHYNGNFGNLLFIWDVIFGTARITRQYPPRFGVSEVPGQGPDPWYVLMLYPFFRRPVKSA